MFVREHSSNNLNKVDVYYVLIFFITHVLRGGGEHVAEFSHHASTRHQNARDLAPVD